MNSSTTEWTVRPACKSWTPSSSCTLARFCQFVANGRDFCNQSTFGSFKKDIMAGLGFCRNCSKRAIIRRVLAGCETELVSEHHGSSGGLFAGESPAFAGSGSKAEIARHTMARV